MSLQFSIWVCVNETFGSFANSLKCANVRHIYKNVDSFSKKNYRSVSILPLLLKVYEGVINEQVLNYFFNEILRGLRKVHKSTQHALFKLLLSRGRFFSSIF